MSQFLQIYDKLLNLHGRQGWWPVTLEGAKPGSLPVYGPCKKTEKQRLEIIVGSVLTQNTQWKPNVERAIVELHRKRLIDIDKILRIDHDTLAQAIRSSGYYNMKAIKLKAMTAFLKEHPTNELMKMTTIEARQLLLGVKGIGPETADSILLYALDKPIFVVDAYTRRIFTHLGLIKEGARYEDIQRIFMEAMQPDAEIFNEFHALIVEHAKRYYAKKPYRDIILTLGPTVPEILANPPQKRCITHR